MDLESELFEQFVSGEKQPEFVREFLLRQKKQGVALSADEWARYGLESDIRLNGTRYGQRFPEKFFDTTYNFCLTYDDRLIGSIGFEVDDTTMQVWQIQGIKGQHAPLCKTRWTRALLDFSVSWARRIGFSRVSVVSVASNEWGSNHLDPVQGKLLYDVTAKRCGFAKEGSYYVLNLVPD